MLPLSSNYNHARSCPLLGLFRDTHQPSTSRIRLPTILIPASCCLFPPCLFWGVKALNNLQFSAFSRFRLHTRHSNLQPERFGCLWPLEWSTEVRERLLIGI